MKFNLLSIVAATAAIGSIPFASAAPDPSRLPIGPTPESSPVPSSPVPSSHVPSLPTPSPLPVPTNYRLAIAEKLEKEFAEMGFVPRPIDDIMSLLELHDDDAEATLAAMMKQEKEIQSEEDDDEGSDFTGNGDELSSSSDEDSSDDMDEDEEEDDDSTNLPSLPPPQVQNRGILGVGVGSGSGSDSTSTVIAIPTRNRGATNRSGSNLQGDVSLSSVSSSSTAMEVDTSSSSGGLASSGGTNSTSTAIVDLTAEDSSDDESVCPLAQREAEREARIAAERLRPPRPNVARAAAAAAPAPASSATTRQIRSNRTLAEALSEEVVEQEDTPSPLANQNSTAKVPLKTSEEEKEKEQIESNHTMANAIAESEMEAAWGSLWQKPQKKNRTKKNRPKSPHQYGMQQRRASNQQQPPAPKPPAPKPTKKPRLLKGQQTVKKPSQPRKSGKPNCSTPGCTNVAAPGRRGLCRRCADGPAQECSNDGCTRKAANGRGGLCRRCADGTRTCSVPSCTANASEGLKVCLRHHNPCSVPGCNKRGTISSGNGRFCPDHAQSNALNEYAQHSRTINRRHAERYENDPIFRTARRVRARLRNELRRNGTAYRGKLSLIGCTVNQLNRYFELFGCDSEDQHIDHIMPLASFDLTNPEQLRRANHWSNLQPLSAADNLSKGSTPPVGFVWNVERGRWMWSEGSGRTNHDLPAVGAGDVIIDELFDDDDDESDEFDGSGDDNDE